VTSRTTLDDLVNHAPSLTSADDCAENIVIPLLIRTGFTPGQISRKVSITRPGSQGFYRQADIVVYCDGRPMMVVETKRLGHRLKEEDSNQALAYAKLLNPSALFAVLTNGRDWEVYRLDRDEIGGLEDLPGPELLRGSAAQVEAADLPVRDRQAAERVLYTMENRDALAEAFRKCRQLLAKEGLIAETAFDELTKILVCKFNEEKQLADGTAAQFHFSSARLPGEGAVADLSRMFAGARQRFRVFPENTRINIRSNDTAAGIVRALEPFSFYGFRTPLGLAGAGGDIVGSVYETFLTGALRGDLGQYLTPRQIIEFMVELADIQIGERVMDLACGSGGFLIRSFLGIRKKIRLTSDSQEEIDDKIHDLVHNNLWGVDINERLATLCRINLVLHGNGYERIYTGDSIRDDIFANAEGRRVDLRDIERGELPRFDVILMNPPFNLPYEEPGTLQRYELGRGRPQQGSDYLMLERALRLLKPESGRLLIVLPHAIASGEAVEDIRSFVGEKANIHGCISLPVGTFKPFGGSNARTCVLYLRRGKPGKRRFLAQAEAVGYDITTKQYRELSDNDLPDIALAHHEQRSAL
jgi:type I restriction enzyme M protein